jgi:hypothetical protein
MCDNERAIASAPVLPVIAIAESLPWPSLLRKPPV